MKYEEIKLSGMVFGLMLGIFISYALDIPFGIKYLLIILGGIAVGFNIACLLSIMLLEIEVMLEKIKEDWEK
ncbi:MAG: hypothetical protein QXX41_07930 [Nitrososphaerota archaeon]